jgi:hypothetical protein
MIDIVGMLIVNLEHDVIVFGLPWGLNLQVNSQYMHIHHHHHNSPPNVIRYITKLISMYLNHRGNQSPYVGSHMPNK